MSKFVLDCQNISTLSVETIKRIIELDPRIANIHARKDGRDYHWQADWLKYMRWEPDVTPISKHCNKHDQPRTWHPAKDIRGYRGDRGMSEYHCRLCSMTLWETIKLFFEKIERRTDVNERRNTGVDCSGG